MGSEWVRAQAEAQRAARAALIEESTTTITKAQLVAMGTKIGELMKAVVVLNSRTTRLAKWNAEHVLRVVELRAQLKAQWESNQQLAAEKDELRSALGVALGGMPAKVGYLDDDGEYVTKWAAVTAEGKPVANIAALFPDAGSGTGDDNEPAIPPSGFWGAQTPISQCAVCGSLNLQCRMSPGPREECHPGGWNLGQETPGTEDAAGVYEFNTEKAQLAINVLPDDDSGVVHTTGESEGVNQPPTQSTTGVHGEDE